jgi:hypothetical protein
MISGNPTVDDILKDGDLNEHFLNTSCNLLSRLIRKRIPIDDETMAPVAKVRKTRINQTYTQK